MSELLTPFIDLGAQYQHLKSQIGQRIDRVLQHGQYILGPEVSELEGLLAESAGVKYCVSCGNGTDALQLALMALEIGRGDAVFTVPYTFFATAEAISIIGATPVFVDVDPETFNIDPGSLQTAIERVQASGELNPAAIIAVDLFGLPADYTRLEPISSEFGVPLIEDAAQGFGGSLGERMAGSFGEIATTSFFPAKPLGCYGDGGAVFTDRQDLADAVKSLRVHGKGIDKYDNVRIGMNSRLDSIQAAVLLAKLEVFEREVEFREQVARWYEEYLPDNIQLPRVPEGFRSAWAQYTIQTNKQAELKKWLLDQGVPTAIYYAKPLHLMDAYVSLDYQPGDFPVSEKLSGRVLSLPMHPYLDEPTVRQIAMAMP